MFWYLQALKKYADFSGRARRKEYWTFTLINVAIYAVLYILLYLEAGEGVELAFASIAVVYGLMTIVPELAVTTRRLHDTRHSGWWQLIRAVPIAGDILVLVWLIRDGDVEPNQYGPNPKVAPASALSNPVDDGAAIGRTRARRLLPFGLLVLVAVIAGGVFLYALDRGTQEARILAPCTGISASAEEVANLDLAALGLRSTGKQDARSKYGEGFVDGAVVEYSAKGNLAAIVAALRHTTSADAASDFNYLAAWAQGNCGRSAWANFGARGAIHCDYSDGHDMILWNDNWILDIETADLNGVPAAELADQIRDAVAAHWLGLSNASVSRTYERRLVQ